MRAPTKVSERIKKRYVGLPSPKRLAAGSSCADEAGAPGGLLDERIDQRRLAKPLITIDEQKLTLPLASPPEMSLQTGKLLSASNR